MAAILAQFLIGWLLRLLLQSLLPVHRPRLEYPESDELDGFDGEESDKLGSESGSIGPYVTSLAGLLHGVEYSVGVMLLEIIGHSIAVEGNWLCKWSCVLWLPESVYVPMTRYYVPGVLW